MIGFPKTIKTKADLLNTHKMAKRGRLKKEDWRAAVEKLENQNWHMCPVISLSEDRKTVTIMFCAEVETGQRIKSGAVYPSVTGVNTEEVGKTTTDTENAATEGQEAVTDGTETEQGTTGQNTVTYTVLTLSRAISAATKEVGIPAAVTFYDRLGITPEEVEALKEELAE